MGIFLYFSIGAREHLLLFQREHGNKYPLEDPHTSYHFTVLLARARALKLIQKQEKKFGYWHTKQGQSTFVIKTSKYTTLKELATSF